MYVAIYAVLDMCVVVSVVVLNGSGAGSCLWFQITRVPSLAGTLSLALLFSQLVRKDKNPKNSSWVFVFPENKYAR